jgi:6-phosphogluconolactonase
MTTPKLPGETVTLPDAASVAKEAGKRLADALRAAIAARGSASLALSGGNTPRPAYEHLAKEPGVDWSKVSVFFIDERAVEPTSARSNYRLAKESLLDLAPVPAANVHRMLGDAKELTVASRAYERTLGALLEVVADGGHDVPVLDVAVLGVGDDGHTASLFPGETGVDVRDRVAIPVEASAARKTEARLTVTAPVLQQIRTVLVLATGAAKAGPLARVAAETGSLRETPARVLRAAKGQVVWLLDPAATG